jgi:hypothetical protein
MADIHETTAFILKWEGENKKFKNKLTNFMANKKDDIPKSKNINPLIDGKERQNITNEVNQCIAKYGHYKKKLFVSSLGITNNIVMEGSSHILTDLVLNEYFPLNPVREYHHFTNVKAFESILKSKKLRLASVAKRFNEDEYLPFYNAHNMNGYAITDNGKKLGQEICENSFYISFTDNNLTESQENYMWNYFADNNKGVRLVFKLCNDTNLDLRKMYYPPGHNAAIKLITELLEISSKRNRYFVLHGLSKMGFFYLPKKYCIENEYRLLIQKDYACNQLGLPILHQKTGVCKEYEYIEIPFNDKNFPIHLQLEKVIIKNKTNRTEIERILKECPEFEKTLIEVTQ